MDYQKISVEALTVGCTRGKTCDQVWSSVEVHVLQCLSFSYSVNSEREHLLFVLWYNSEHKQLCLSNSTVMISSQKCLTRSQNKALHYVSFLRVDKISCVKLYRIVTSNRRFPDRNCSRARILMEFRGLIPLLYLKFQRLKKKNCSQWWNWSLFTRLTFCNFL
jgi:hypothetical protein